MGLGAIEPKANRSKPIALQDTDWKKRHWFRVALRLQGSVIFAILPRVILCSTFGFLIQDSMN
jgi:putative membrane protein